MLARAIERTNIAVKMSGKLPSSCRKIAAQILECRASQARDLGGAEDTVACCVRECHAGKVKDYERNRPLYLSK